MVSKYFSVLNLNLLNFRTESSEKSRKESHYLKGSYVF